MTTPPDPNPPADSLWERIAAFADGELDAEQCDDLLREVAENPETAKSAEHQRQLRKLLAGCMDCEVTMRCPEELKKAIAGIADESTAPDQTQSPPETAEPTAPTPLARIGRHPASPWRWGIAAALLFAAIGGFYVFNSERNAADDPAFATQIGDLPPAAQAPAGAGISLAAFSDRRLNMLVSRHVQCSAGLTSPGNTDAYSTDPQTLVGQVADTFGGTPVPVRLDLDRAGLSLRLAGRCVAPGRGAMHLLYDAQPTIARPDDNAPAATVSLWIKPYDQAADPICTPGQLEVLADDGRPHPVMLWRDADLMYVLVGDAMDQVIKAQTTLVADAI